MDRLSQDQLRDAVEFAPSASQEPADVAPAVAALLGEEVRRGWVRPAVVVGLLLALALLLFLAAPYVYRGLQPAVTGFETVAVRQGDLSVVVTVTGALAPVNEVDVGSELSGTIVSVEVEENDQVRKGQVLATLDMARLRDQVAQGEAAMASAEANVAQAAATVGETRLRATRLNNLFTMSSGGWPARADVDVANAAYDRAQAVERSARGAVLQARASLSTARTNLAKAVIRSPVDGVVLMRKAEPGQTVAASLQAPVLFTLAEDMSRMELHADIDEADVGQMQEGQAALFTVDAYPGRQYPARVTRVGYGAQTKDGVVTYTGVLSVDNADLSLRPGMTASADIRTVTHRDVLLVPDAALRFTPPQSSQGSNSLSQALMPRLPGAGAPRVRRSSDPSRQQIWVLEGGQPTVIAVRVGSSDGRETEVSGPGLRPGLKVITGTPEPRS